VEVNAGTTSLFDATSLFRPLKDVISGLLWTAAHYIDDPGKCQTVISKNGRQIRRARALLRVLMGEEIYR
jgi:hypothetical protein